MAETLPSVLWFDRTNNAARGYLLAGSVARAEDTAARARVQMAKAFGTEALHQLDLLPVRYLRPFARTLLIYGATKAEQDKYADANVFYAESARVNRQRPPSVNRDLSAASIAYGAGCSYGARGLFTGATTNFVLALSFSWQASNESFRQPTATLGKEAIGGDSIPRQSMQATRGLAEVALGLLSSRMHTNYANVGERLLDESYDDMEALATKSEEVETPIAELTPSLNVREQVMSASQPLTQPELQRVFGLLTPAPAIDWPEGL